MKKGGEGKMERREWRGERENGGLVKEHHLLGAVEGHFQLIQDITAQDSFFSPRDWRRRPRLEAERRAGRPRRKRTLCGGW